MHPPSVSYRFYETFGDELTNELVDWLNQVDVAYRTELRSLNESNFARFDAKLDQRLAEYDAKWEKRMAHAEAEWKTQFAGLALRSTPSAPTSSNGCSSSGPATP